MEQRKTLCSHYKIKKNKNKNKKEQPELILSILSIPISQKKQKKSKRIIFSLSGEKVYIMGSLFVL